MGDQTASLILARIDLKILFGAVKAEQDFCDSTIALATKAGVKRAQRQGVPKPELRGQCTIFGAGRTAIERAPESASGVNAQFEKGIQWQGCGVEVGGTRNGLCQPELMRNPIDLPDAMPAIYSATQVEAVEMGERNDTLRLVAAMPRGGEHYCLRLKAWIPEQGLPIRRGFRIGWKIATPSAGRRLPGDPIPARSKR